MNAKDYEAEWKWLSSSVAKQRGDAAKTDAFTEFKKRFPSADESRFIAQIDFDPNRKATARVHSLYKKKPKSQSQLLNFLKK